MPVSRLTSIGIHPQTRALWVSVGDGSVREVTRPRAGALGIARSQSLPGVTRAERMRFMPDGGLIVYNGAALVEFGYDSPAIRFIIGKVYGFSDGPIDALFTTGQSRDDTPKHSVSAWASYQVKNAGRLTGLQFGLGGQWDSEREYFSGITVAGQKQTNGKGELTVLKHKARLNLDMMVRYPFKLRDRDAYVQLNATNILDDDDLYGLIYAPGRNVRFEFGYTF